MNSGTQKSVGAKSFNLFFSISRLLNFLKLSLIHLKDIELGIPIFSKFAKIFLEKIYVAYKEIRSSIIPKIKGKKMRHHGYLRSPSYINNLTRKANCNSKLIMRSNTYDIYEIRPN